MNQIKHYIAVNHSQKLVLAPDGQLYNMSDKETLIAAQCTFADEVSAQRAAKMIVKPKFKVEPL